MLILYQAVVSLLLLISPLIIIYRILKKKKTPQDLKKNFVCSPKKEWGVNLYGFMVQVLGKF